MKTINTKSLAESLNNTEINTEINKQNIRKKYSITKLELDNLGMSEFDYENWKEREDTDFLFGTIFEINSTNEIEHLPDDIINSETLAKNIQILHKISPPQEFKTVLLGEICAHFSGTQVTPPQIIKLTDKIYDKLHSHSLK